MKKILAIFLVAIFMLTTLIACAMPTVKDKKESEDASVEESSSEGIVDNEESSELDEDSEDDFEDEETDDFETDPEDESEKVTDTEKESNTEKESESDKESEPNKESETETDKESETEKESESNNSSNNDDESNTDTEDVEQGCAHSNIENGKCTSCNVQFYYQEGDVILFGEYPQTVKADSVEIVGTTPDSRGYYLGSDNEYYAKVTAKPFGEGYEFSTGREVKKQNTYYFKVEPIRWRIVSKTEGEALVLCESILINQAYDATSNVYADSEVAKWLSQTFIETAFSTLQSEIIIARGTEQKVFLISEADAFANGETRKLLTTDFARANGAWMSTTVGKGTGIWWLSSASAQSTDKVKVVTNTGLATNYELVKNASFGVVPALRILMK